MSDEFKPFEEMTKEELEEYYYGTLKQIFSWTCDEYVLSMDRIAAGSFVNFNPVVWRTFHKLVCVAMARTHTEWKKRCAGKQVQISRVKKNRPVKRPENSPQFLDLQEYPFPYQT